MICTNYCNCVLHAKTQCFFSVLSKVALALTFALVILITSCMDIKLKRFDTYQTIRQALMMFLSNLNKRSDYGL